MRDNEKHSIIADFFRREQKKMAAFANRFLNNADAVSGEDIVQDVFTHLFDMPDLTIPVEALSSYVYTALRNRITDFFRKKRVPTLSATEEYDIVSLIEDTRADTEDLLLLSIQSDILYDSLKHLTELEQKIIIETEFENRPFKDIAEETGIALGTLLSKKSRALNKLRKIITEELDYDTTA